MEIFAVNIIPLRQKQLHAVSAAETSQGCVCMKICSKTLKIQVENCFFFSLFKLDELLKERWLCAVMWVWLLSIPQSQKSWLNDSITGIIFTRYIPRMWRVVSQKPNGNSNAARNKTWQTSLWSAVLRLTAQGVGPCSPLRACVALFTSPAAS